MIAIQNFQQRLYARYKPGLGLPQRYAYIYGNPVQPVIPLNLEPQAVCIIGGYPPARLATVKAEPGVPVADVCAPFGLEPHFDGTRIETRTEGMRLAELYLKPLGLRREQCWLTYLVRVFLFKDEHLARYRRLGCPWPEQETASQFERLARQGLPWLEEELALVKPRLVITLGAEVAGVLQDVPGREAYEWLLKGDLQDLWLDDQVYPAIHLPDFEELTASPPQPQPDFQRRWAEHLAVARQVIGRLVV